MLTTPRREIALRRNGRALYVFNDYFCFCVPQLTEYMGHDAVREVAEVF
jgi:hypothetical protein